MSEIPEIMETGGERIPPGTPTVKRQYLEIPEDEVPVVDPRNPTRATGIPVREAEPTLLRIMVNFDPRPLMEAINEAVRANDINKVITLFRNAKIEAEQTGKMLVTATLRPK